MSEVPQAFCLGIKEAVVDYVLSRLQPGTEQASDADVLNGLFTEHIHCWGFPDFNPSSRQEFSGFLNFMCEVFHQASASCQLLLVDAESVLAQLHIQGRHQEEFMGLAATGGQLTFHATVLFRLHQGQVNHMGMYNKQLTLKTHQGSVYQLLNAH